MTQPANGAEPDQKTIRRAFWQRYAELYPAIAGQRALAANTARWQDVPGRPVVISRYKATTDVGIFLRGLGGVRPRERAEIVRPHIPALTERLGIAAGRTNQFCTPGPAITNDPATWDAAIHWLEEQTRRYVDAVKDIFPEDQA